MQPVRSHGVKGPPSFLLVGDSGMGGGSQSKEFPIAPLTFIPYASANVILRSTIFVGQSGDPYTRK